VKLSIVGPIVVLAGVSTLCTAIVATEIPPAGSTAASQSAHVPAQQNGPKTANSAGQREHAWWSEHTAARIGSIGGTMAGMLGGLLGGLGGCGKARRFVLTLDACVAGLGAMLLITGVIALTLGQPYAVYYPLLLGGIAGTAVFGGIWPVLRAGYEQREMRRMAAMDAGLVHSRSKEVS
jgi:hypothetical protein